MSCVECTLFLLVDHNQFKRSKCVLLLWHLNLKSYSDKNRTFSFCRTTHRRTGNIFTLGLVFQKLFVGYFVIEAAAGFY